MKLERLLPWAVFVLAIVGWLIYRTGAKANPNAA